MNWLDAALFILDIISESNGHLRGLTMNEYVPLFSLLLLMGGVLFWLFIMGAILLGAFRLVRRGAWAVVDFMPTRRASGGKITPREPKDDEVGPFMLDPQRD